MVTIGINVRPQLALQLHFSADSESMGRHDVEVMDGGSID
jgi:hypothetical protein